MDYVARYGIGVITAEKRFYACSFGSFIHLDAPRRLKKVRVYPNRMTGFRSLSRWMERLWEEPQPNLIEGRRTPFRFVVLKNAYTEDLVQYLAREEPKIEVEVISPEEVRSLTGTAIDRLPEDPKVDVEIIARLSARRRRRASSQ